MSTESTAPEGGSTPPLLTTLTLTTERDHALWAAYLLRDLRRRMDADRIGRSRMMGIARELGDALVPVMVAEKTPLGWFRHLCERFESDPTEAGHARGFVACAWTPIGRASWSTVITAMDARLLRLVLMENPALFASFACEKPYDGEHLLFDAFSAARPAAPVVRRSGLLATTIPRGYSARWRAESPTAHGADAKSGNVTLFRRQLMVDALTGQHERVPTMPGNAVRGAWRDRAFTAGYLGLLGLTPRDIPARTAHAFLAGGSIAAGADTQNVNVALRAKIRRLCPMWDLFAGCINDQVMQGAGRVGFAVLVCRETAWQTWRYLADEGESLEAYAARLPEASALTTLQLKTRMAHKDLPDADGSQMLVNTELVIAGAEWHHTVSVNGNLCAPEVTLSALAWMLDEFQQDGHVGARNAEGWGRIAFDRYAPVGGAPELPSPKVYLDHVAAVADEARAWLRGKDVEAELREINGDAPEGGTVHKVTKGRGRVKGGAAVVTKPAAIETPDDLDFGGGEGA